MPSPATYARSLIIEGAFNIADLGVELWPEFERAYEKDHWNDAVIEGIYNFALWCWTGTDYKGNSVLLVKAVMLQFFEPLPRNIVRRKDMPRWLCLKEFELLQSGPFRYYISAEDHAQMVKDFRRAKEKMNSREPERCLKQNMSSELKEMFGRFYPLGL